MRPLVIANWKMNETNQEADQLLSELASGLGTATDAEVVICPPFTALGVLSNYSYAKGAQDIHWADRGTFTGEISGPMLRGLGCKYVLIGHSERRWKLGESDEIINKKIKAALRNELIPVLCVGERQMDRNNYQEFIYNQLEAAWRDLGVEDLGEIIIAYEPVWAIGTGQVGSKNPATALDIKNAYAVIKKFLQKEKLEGYSRLVYGGSVDSENVGELLGVDGNQGFLVGGASLVPDEFAKIVKSVSSSFGDK